MLGRVLGELQDVRSNVSLREIGDRIAVGLKKHKNVLAVRDPGPAEADAHAPAQRFKVQEPFGQRFGGEKPTRSSGRKRTLLPRQSH